MTPRGKRTHGPGTKVDAPTRRVGLAKAGRLVGRGESVAKYADRWCAWRDERGLECVAGDRTRLALHVCPLIGALAITGVTRDDLKRLVLELDAKATRGSTRSAGGKRRPFSRKSGVNVWSTVRAMFRDAQRAKLPELCVRDDNPAAGVAGPDEGARKAKAYLWPSEFVALVSCESIPLRWRRLFALAVYTYTRAGELAALEWSDVDLEHGTIHVHRAKSSTREGTKPTKTEVARRFAIEPALLPLLRAIHAEAKGRGALFKLPSTGGRSRTLRLYLGRAGVTRADLHATDQTRKAMTFHDLRATGLTWCAVRGDDALKIMQRAGHADFNTTRIYLREAENLRAGFGVVFPSLPPDLLAQPLRLARSAVLASAPAPVYEAEKGNEVLWSAVTALLAFRDRRAATALEARLALVAKAIAEQVRAPTRGAGRQPRRRAPIDPAAADLAALEARRQLFRPLRPLVGRILKDWDVVATDGEVTSVAAAALHLAPDDPDRELIASGEGPLLEVLAALTELTSVKERGVRIKARKMQMILGAFRGEKRSGRFKNADEVEAAALDEYPAGVDMLKLALNAFLPPHIASDLEQRAHDLLRQEFGLPRDAVSGRVAPSAVGGHQGDAGSVGQPAARPIPDAGAPQQGHRRRQRTR